MIFLFLMAALGLVVGGVTAAKSKALIKRPSLQILPKAVSALLVGAQLSEILRLVEHATFTEVIAALLLLAVLLATKSGTETELHRP